MPASEQDESERILHAQALLGERASMFLNSDIGRYVIDRSLNETKEIISKLKGVNAVDVVKVQELQNSWRVAEQALVWLYEAVAAGKQSLSILDAVKEE